tara:strand:- start:880 stop:1035 length:156 start_codon:yes stop_codon:yes gene_type:complete
MAEELKANYGKDTGSGKKLNTGSLRRSYSTKKKKSKKFKYKIKNNNYKQGI